MGELNVWLVSFDAPTVLSITKNVTLNTTHELSISVEFFLTMGIKILHYDKNLNWSLEKCQLHAYAAINTISLVGLLYNVFCIKYNVGTLYSIHSLLYIVYSIQSADCICQKKSRL